MSTVSFDTKLYRIGKWTILSLPPDISSTLPSRGITVVEGTINGFYFHTTLEPDGKGSHWFRITTHMCKAAGAVAGDTVTLTIKPSQEWLEPKMPDDLKNALAIDPQAYAQWVGITPIARWDWIRWIRSARQSVTRKHRIVTACDKLRQGERRPCCFNRSQCTEPYVAHNGVLLDSKI